MFQGRRQLSKAAPQQQAPQGAEHDLHRVRHRRPLLLPQPAQDRHRGLRGQPDLVSPQVLYRTVLVAQMAMDYSFKCPGLQFFTEPKLCIIFFFPNMRSARSTSMQPNCLNFVGCSTSYVETVALLIFTLCHGKFCISSILELLRLGANAL